MFVCRIGADNKVSLTNRLYDSGSDRWELDGAASLVLVRDVAEE